MPTIDLTDDENAAVTAAIRRLIEEDKSPHAPRLDPLRAALGKFEGGRRANPHPKTRRRRRATSGLGGRSRQRVGA